MNTKEYVNTPIHSRTRIVLETKPRCSVVPVKETQARAKITTKVDIQGNS